MMSLVPPDNRDGEPAPSGGHAPPDRTSATLSAAALARVRRDDDGGLVEVRRFVARVRRRWGTREFRAALAAVVAGTAGALLAASAGGALFGSAPVAIVLLIVLLAGVVLAGAGLARTARALRRRPSGHDVADWIEHKIPGLRDSLATAIEGGSLASVSAKYAAARLMTARDVEFEPPPVLRARRLLLAASAAFVAVAVFARALLPRNGTIRSREPDLRAPAAPGNAAADAHSSGGRPTRTSSAGRPGRSAVGARDPEDLTRVRSPVNDLPQRAQRAQRADRSESSVSSVASRSVEIVPLPRAGPRAGGRRLGPAHAAEVLVSAPEGFERAVELFVGSAPPEP